MSESNTDTTVLYKRYHRQRISAALL